MVNQRDQGLPAQRGQELHLIQALNQHRLRFKRRQQYRHQRIDVFVRRRKVMQAD